MVRKGVPDILKELHGLVCEDLKVKLPCEFEDFMLCEVASSAPDAGQRPSK